MTEVQVTSYDGAQAEEVSATVHSIYAAEYPPGPDFEEWRDGLWARHRARTNFELLIAHDGDEIAGLVWGYVGDRGQYWTDAVAAALDDGTVGRWLGGHFEVVELIVRPTYRRRGIGRRLLTSLTQRSTAPRAMLSVLDANEPAVRLYSSLGWVRLGALDERTSVMGWQREETSAPHGHAPRPC